MPMVAIVAKFFFKHFIRITSSMICEVCKILVWYKKLIILSFLDAMTRGKRHVIRKPSSSSTEDTEGSEEMEVIEEIK